MTTLIAWANTQQNIPLQNIPKPLLTEELLHIPNDNRRVQQRHRCRWVAHFLLWELCKTAGISTALLGKIARTESGRPYFPVENVDFNISHSGDWVAVILNVKETGKSAVGIDIEFPKRTRNYTALLQHFAAQNEQDWFAVQTNPDTAFYRIWCLREAILKSQGVGIAKLTEVAHFPELQLLNSSHCPSGELFFTQELPFYLSFFVNENSLSNIGCFQWKKDHLKPFTLKSAVKYRVNSQ